MTEFVTAVKEALEDQAGAGELLDGVAVLENHHDGKTERCVVIERMREEFTGQSATYESVKGTAKLWCLAHVGKLTSDSYREREEVAEAIAIAVRRVVGANRTLATTSFPGGFVRRGTMAQFRRAEFGSDSQKSGWYVYVALELVAEYVVRDGGVKLN